MTDKLLTAREVGAILRISQASIYRRLADGTLPKPMKVGRLIRWPESEIIASVKAAKERRAS